LVTRVKWIEPDYVASQAGLFGSAQGLDPVEQLYATALQQEQDCLESCVDLFFEVAIATSRHQGSACSCRNCRLHKSALNKLVVTGQRYGRLDPSTCLVIRRRGHEETIPITHRGFVWQPSDFHSLIPVGKYKTNGLRKLYRREGVGVPLVVTSRRPDDGSFVTRQPTFAATLRMNIECCGLNWVEQENGLPISCCLELYDPLRIDQTPVQGELRQIAKDLSAPLAYRLRNDPQTILDDFINPGSATGETELRAIEPYQPGKIPVVFVHGLLSNPYTWAEMINDLQAHPGFVDHFQIWVVEYSTGQPFLTSAAECREQLRMARHTFDPTHVDAQLSNMVLVGHSMGGLVSKLQVTSSGDRLWRSVANRPYHQVAIPAEFRQKLTNAFFFEPSPDVSRVVFIGTPHRGSGFASRSIGRLGSALVEEPEDLVRAHAELIRCNPGVFSKEVSRRIPTSIDLLEPKSKLLEAIAALPARCDVRMHSVIGNSCWTLLNGKSDGVVPVKSARENRAVSERLIKTIHTRLTKHPETVQELLAILQRHLEESCNTCIASTVSQVDVDVPVTGRNFTDRVPLVAGPELIGSEANSPSWQELADRYEKLGIE
jgi:hypothetical protein